MDDSDINVIKNIESSLPEGLQETYTDFDAWITKWNWKIWKYKQRVTLRNTPSSNPKLQLKTEDSKILTITLNSLLVNGFTVNEIAVPKKLILKLELIQTEDYNHLTDILMRLLQENSRRIHFNSKL